MKVASLSCLILVAAQVSLEEAHTAGLNQTLDEVIVRGMRLNTHQLRKMIVAAEDLFYARYNELNKRDEFDVKCIVAANTGTNLKHRSCRAVYEERAAQQQAREIFLIRQDVQDQLAMGGLQRPPGGPPAGADRQIEVLRPAFQANMLQVVQKDKELRELLEDRALFAKALSDLKSRGHTSDIDTESIRDTDVPSTEDARH